MRSAQVRERMKGLTLVEMLVVMGICGALALLLAPVLFRARAEARRVVCANNLGGLGQAYAVCLMESNNYLPAAYYSIQRTQESCAITLRSHESGPADKLFNGGVADALICPSDSRPVQVAASNTRGAFVAVGASYAYNVALPAVFRNASRVTDSANTVTFYDGDAGRVCGEWRHDRPWAAETIRRRHRESANYLFLDGHVENSAGFPDRAFDGGSAWAARDGRSSGAEGGSGWSGGNAPVPPPSEQEQIEIAIADGRARVREAADATITCIGAAFQYGEGGPRIPVWAYYAENGKTRQLITKDVLGGETVTLDGLKPGDTITVSGKTVKYYKSDYSSDDKTGHVWVLRDGDTVPSVAGFDQQGSVQSFLVPYMASNGALTLGQNDVIFLFELSEYTDYRKYSCADFQDLVTLVSFSKAEDTMRQQGIAGSLNINPNNNDNFEFQMRLPDGFRVTRDDLHADAALGHAGFNASYLEYAGPAVWIWVKPKGNGNQNSLIVNGRPFQLANKNRYIIESASMTVRLYNDKRNGGKAMGRWWLDINAQEATIRVVK